MFILLTVKPCAINSSGTNSGLNIAGVTQGYLVLAGSRVTITSPLAGSTEKEQNVKEQLNIRTKILRLNALGLLRKAAYYKV